MTRDGCDASRELQCQYFGKFSLLAHESRQTDFFFFLSFFNIISSMIYEPVFDILHDEI